MNDDFNYETSLWDNAVLEMLRSGLDVADAVVAADAVIKARRNTFPTEAK